MNFLEWLKIFIPALGFLAMGFAGDGDGGGDDDSDDDDKDDKDDSDDDDQDDKKDDDKKFDYAYVKKLREEAKANRIKASKLEDENKKREDEKLKADGEHEKRADKIQKEADDAKVVFVKRIKLSELKAMAVSMGIIDGQLVELVKLKDVDMDDEFNPTNIKEVMEDFKEKHPKLFDDNEDDDDRDPEDNRKPGRKDNKSPGDLDEKSGSELLRMGFSGDKKNKKRKKN